MSHIGIRLRIRVPAGVLFDADSDAMHYQARFGEMDMCTPRCLPGCTDHGWLSLVPGPPDMALVGLMQDGTEFHVEIKPVELPDDCPDDDAE